MKVSATITYPYDERIIKLFSAEAKSFDRAQYTLQTQHNNLIFSILATDATALRACMTTITKILSVWEATASHE
jgi:tRNA threonylcarbamoyladenosine modification (KEOPS) complex  Pcc1 subunit